MPERLVILLIWFCFALIAFGSMEFSLFPNISQKGSIHPHYDAVNTQIKSSPVSKADKQRNEAFERLFLSFSFFVALSMTFSTSWFILTLDEEEE